MKQKEFKHNPMTFITESISDSPDECFFFISWKQTIIILFVTHGYFKI